MNLNRVNVGLDWQSAETGPKSLPVVYGHVDPPNPSAAPKTLLSLHGTPGSHNNFEYMVDHVQQKEFRFLAPDFPGHGYTMDDSFFKHDSKDRARFLSCFLEDVSCSKVDVLMIHSSSAFPALQFVSDHPEKCKSVILAAPAGLRPHRAVRSHFHLLIQVVFFLWSVAILRPILKFIAKFVLTRVLKFRLDPGAQDEVANVAMVATRVAAQWDFATYRTQLSDLNRSNTPVFIVYGALDPVVDAKIFEELVDALNIPQESRFVVSKEEEEASLLERVKVLHSGGVTKFAIRFENEKHHINKTKAQFLVELADVAQQMTCPISSNKVRGRY